MIGSPSDTADLVDVAIDVVHQINRIRISESEVLEPVHWSKNSTPGFHPLGPQGEVDQQITDGSDLLVAIFRHRLGTPTQNDESGTVSEIRSHVESGRLAMVYFSKEDPPAKLSGDEKDRLAEFKDWCFTKGVMGNFESADDFRKTLSEQLHTKVTQNPLNSVLRIKALGNRPVRELELLLRAQVGFRYDRVQIDEDETEFGCYTFEPKAPVVGDPQSKWTKKNQIPLGKSIDLKIDELLREMGGEFTHSFKFFLRVPNNRKTITKYVNRLSNGDVVVTGGGDNDTDGDFWRIWFLHPEGFVHPYISKSFMANHSLFDLSGL